MRALGPGRRPRERSDLPAVPGVPIAGLVQTSSYRWLLGSPALPVNPDEPSGSSGTAGKDVAGAQRKLVVRGPADPPSACRSRLVDTRFAWRDRLDCAPASVGDVIVRYRAIHPMSERPCDRRCSSGSSLGKALSSARIPAQRAQRPRARTGERPRRLDRMAPGS
jgi:hypothetical protein